MEQIGENRRKESVEGSFSLGEYLSTPEKEELMRRSEEVSRTIDQLLVYDENGELKGILDDTYLDDRGVRRLAGNSFVQTEELSHLRFILNTSPRDLLELDDIELPSGSTLGDAVYARDEVVSLSKSEASTIEEAIARRAVIIRIACDVIIEELECAGIERKSA